MNTKPKVTVSKTLDGWTVCKWSGVGTNYLKVTSPRLHGRLTKKEAVEIARMVGKRDGLPVEIGT